MFVVLSGRSKDNSCSQSLSRLGKLHVKAGYIIFNPSSRVARLAGAPFLHVNRPLQVHLHAKLATALTGSEFLSLPEWLKQYLLLSHCIVRRCDDVMKSTWFYGSRDPIQTLLGSLYCIHGKNTLDYCTVCTIFTLSCYSPNRNWVPGTSRIFICGSLWAPWFSNTSMLDSVPLDQYW